MAYQRVLQQSTRVLSGTGVHSGRAVKMMIEPTFKSGYFFGSSVKGSPTVEASLRNVTDTNLRTTLGNRVQTIEHVLAALWGMNIHSALVTLDTRANASGSSVLEPPILDGSAHDIVAALKAVPFQEVQDSREFLSIQKPLKVQSSDSTSIIKFMPSASSRPLLEFKVIVEFGGVVETAELSWDWSDVAASALDFELNVASARTFVYEREVARMKQLGLGLGGNKDNCIVFADNHDPINTRLRYRNEKARHKLLDLIGDFALVGSHRMVGVVEATRPGHAINVSALRKLLASPEIFVIGSR